MRTRNKTQWIIAVIATLLWLSQATWSIKKTDWGWQALVAARQKPVTWRSVRFFFNPQVADFLSFVHALVPLDARVVVPPPDSDDEVGNMTVMQWALFPRRTFNCTTAACMTQWVTAKTACTIIVRGAAPPGPLPNEHLHMWNDTWGVVVPPSIGSGEKDPRLSAGRWALETLAEVALLLTMLVLGLGLLRSTNSQPTQLSLPWLIAAWALGSGALTFGVFLLMLWGTPTRTAGWLMGGAAWLFAGIVLWRERATLSTQIRRGWHSLKQHRRWAIGLGILGGWVLLIALVGIGKGYHSADALGIWAAKGYGLAQRGIYGARFGWIRDYPLNLPLLIALPKALWSDLTGMSKLIFPAFLWGTLMLIYNETYRRTRSAFWSFLGGAFWGTTPLVLYHSTVAYANLALAFYLFVGVWLWHEKQRLWAAGLALAWGVWTRPEGSLIVGAILLVGVGVEKLQKRPVLPVVLPPLAVSGVWWWAKTHVVYTQKVYQTLGVAKPFAAGVKALLFHGEIRWNAALYLLGALRRLAWPSLWGVLGGVILVLALLFGLKQWREDTASSHFALAGLAVIAATWGIYYFAAYQPNTSLSWWVETGFDRMMLPAMLLLWYSVWMAFVQDKRVFPHTAHP